MIQEYARFCGECGSPLTPGARFCEQCGSPVPVPARGHAPGMDVPAGSAVTIIPFVQVKTGFFSLVGCTMVITGKDLVIIPWTAAMKEEMAQIQEKVLSALEKSGLDARSFWEIAASVVPGIPRSFLKAPVVPKEIQKTVIPLITGPGLSHAPWTEYQGRPPESVGADNPGTRRIPLASIEYVRGEVQSEDFAGSDLLMVRTKDREERFFIPLGLFFAARQALFSALERLMPASRQGPEAIISIVPACFEPGPPGFEFQYYFNLVFTDRRLILAITPGTEDEVEEAWKNFDAAVRQAARERGESPGDYAAANDIPSAPWRVFERMDTGEILDYEGVNYFIPYASIREISFLPGSGPALAIQSATHTIALKLSSPDYVERPLQLAKSALQDRVRITFSPGR
ncbi:MAG: zinc ribbon domain-containing protein [Methanolinea sp.]|nr:zinc ribbon domain-containing protein [Methanolinea sp.]